MGDGEADLKQEQESSSSYAAKENSTEGIRIEITDVWKDVQGWMQKNSDSNGRGTGANELGIKQEHLRD